MGVPVVIDWKVLMKILGPITVIYFRSMMVIILAQWNAQWEEEIDKANYSILSVNEALDQ